MRSWLLAACLLVAAPLAAEGTPLTWLSGTQGWESTPMEELDLQALGSGGEGRTLAGIGGQWGLLDELQASGQWEGPVPRVGDPDAELGLRLREPYFPDDRPAFSVYGRAPYLKGAWSAWGGIAADWEPLDSDLALNAELGDDGSWRLRGGLWTPYVATTLRLGFEASWLNASAEALTPQILVNAPGDLSFQAGLRYGVQDHSELWTLCLSYELFPNP
ncbi:MAG TPA: hypothetical protein VK914_12000 [bacterium]|jgi:hypothetical protein|nr:hypothetical protein [bacterium]